jgi:ring-1,2-phenylacetyl-CoA epoxidase subunit PaaB
MPDTQWPRYQVFLQEKPGSPYQDVGSIHAADAEIALLNARDVFVRRPECASLWVVPAWAIYARTAQEIRDSGFGSGLSEAQGGENETYNVFGKSRPSGAQAFLGTVHASSAAQALQAGVEAFSGDKPVYAWCVFPARRVIASEPADVESFFTPAEDKPFRLSNDFHTVSAMRQLKIGKYDEGRTHGD